MTRRVAYLLKKFPRLSETFVLNEIISQEELGTPLHVFSRRRHDDEPRHPQMARLRAPVEVLPSVREIDPWSTLFGADRDDELLARLGPVVSEFGAFGHPRFGSLMAEAVWLRRRCRELDIEHVHVHFATDAAVVAALVEALGGPGYSITMHAKDIYRNTVDPKMLARMVGGSRFVVTVCDANVRYLQELLGEEAARPVRRLYNGIDLDDFAFRPDGRDANHVLAVGRLVEKKGLDVLLEALASLSREGVPFEATIVGDGEEREPLQRLANRPELAGRVHLTGPLPQDEVAALMSRATVFCLPCIIGEDGNRDALPTVLLEALARGLPAVSTTVTGIPEILDQGRAGIIVPEHDVEGTARAMRRLLEHADERATLAAAGRRHAEQLFDRKLAAASLHEWFNEVPERTDACASRA